MRKATAILVAALAIAGTVALRPAFAEKWALMIGVNDYISERIPDLRGCENDVKLLRTVLIQRYGFPEKNIRVLFSRDATKENILGAIDTWLARQAGPDDVVLFHFSGHGSQAPDRNKDEDDGIDETICPTDIRTDQSMRDILDEELGNALAQIKAGHLSVVLDCCHSGTGTRDLDDLLSPVTVGDRDEPMKTSTRYIFRKELFPTLILAPDSESLVGAMFADLGAPGAGTRALRDAAGSRGAELPYALLTGCRADQTSADAPFPLDGNRYYYFGALTYNLADALLRAAPGDTTLTYEKLAETVTARIKARSFKQDPQLEGAEPVRTSRIFHLRLPDAPPPPPAPTTPPKPTKPFALVTTVGADRVELNCGSVAGVTENSVYTLYEPNDAQLEGPGVGLAVVKFVGATSSVAMLRRADPARLKRGCRAVETLHAFPQNRLYVYVTGEQGEAVAAALQKVPFVVITRSTEQYCDRILRVFADGGRLRGRLVDMQGGRLPDRVADNASGLVTALRGNLSNAYIIKRLTLLENPSAPFKVKVWVEGDAKKTEGEKIVFKFRADRDCYLNLVDCGTSGQVTVLFPNAYHKDNRIQANREYAIPSADMGFDIETQGPSGRELVKAIATLKPLNLMDFDFSRLVEDQPFLTRSLDESQAEPERLGASLAWGLGDDLVTAGRRKDFKVRPKPTSTASTAVAPQAPPKPPVVQQATMPTMTPPKPPAVTPAPPKPQAQPVPVEVDENTIPTSGWATDSVLVDVKGKGV